MKMTKLLKTTVMTLTLCLSLSFGAVLTANAEELSDAAKANLEWKDCPVTQVTPGGVNIYGYQSVDAENPLITGQMTDSREWPAVYVNAIDAAGITNEMSDYDKAVAIANYLCGALEYDYALEAQEESGEGATYEEDRTEEELRVTGTIQHGNVALEKGSGVCGHYASAFEDLCCMVNVECYSVGGYVDGSKFGHKWNEIHIGDKIYYTDVTWLDTGRRSSEYLMSETEWSDHHRGRTSQYYYTDEYVNEMRNSIIIEPGYPEDFDPETAEWHDF